jgi:hypothetical protein
MTRNLLWLLAGLILGVFLAFAIKTREFNRLSATNRELTSQLESVKRQVELQKHELALQQQLTEAATATVRMATAQLKECDQALHHASTRMRNQ